MQSNPMDVINHRERAIFHGALATVSWLEFGTSESKTRKFLSAVCGLWHMWAVWQHVTEKKE
jgi:hypothetical protein